MSTKLLYFGPQWAGSTSLQRLHAFQKLEGMAAIGVDNGASIGKPASLWSRVRWKLRLPMDVLGENQRLIESVLEHRPDIVLVDNCKVITRKTLAALRELGASRLVYYSPDDIAAPHNLSLPLKWSLPDWDVVCTTKTFNVPELAAMGVRRPFLIGKSFDPSLHQAMTQTRVGAGFEEFDAVFIGTYEPERCASINALAESGASVVVYGETKGNWRPSHLRAGIELRPSVFAEEYVRAWHSGKVALCFLRKINRDRITQRTMEIAAIGRPMVAERTDEHDQHFQDGVEYLGFSDDAELVTAVGGLLQDPSRCLALGQAGRRRCIASGYSTADRAAQMLQEFLR